MHTVSIATPLHPDPLTIAPLGVAWSLYPALSRFPVLFVLVPILGFVLLIAFSVTVALALDLALAQLFQLTRACHPVLFVPVATFLSLGLSLGLSLAVVLAPSLTRPLAQTLAIVLLLLGKANRAVGLLAAFLLTLALAPAFALVWSEPPSLPH